MINTALIPWLDPEILINGFGPWALLGVCAIVFAETGLLIGFLFPGDTLLIITGLLARHPEAPHDHVDGLVSGSAVGGGPESTDELGHVHAGPEPRRDRLVRFVERVFEVVQTDHQSRRLPREKTAEAVWGPDIRTRPTIILATLCRRTKT